jgi:predicted DNA-binding transcriptional regulator AlpA
MILTYLRSAWLARLDALLCRICCRQRFFSRRRDFAFPKVKSLASIYYDGRHRPPFFLLAIEYQEFSTVTMNHAAEFGDELVATEIVAAILQCSALTVRRLVAAGKLPRPLKVGRLNRWRRGDIVAAIAS